MIGDMISIISSKMLLSGSIGMLNILLKNGIASITIISKLDAIIAKISLLLLNTFVLNNDFLLFLTLNTCTNSDKASVVNAIV